MHHVTKTSDALYLGGKEGIYAVTDDKHAFIPFDVEIAKNINRVSDIYVSAGNEVWVAAGGMFQVYGDRLQSPSFMNPILNSDSIRSITKISESTTGDLLFASSQLGLVTLSNIHRGINLLHHNGQVLRSNVSDSGIDLSGEALLQVGSNNYVLNTGSTSTTRSLGFVAGRDRPAPHHRCVGGRPPPTHVALNPHIKSRK